MAFRFVHAADLHLDSPLRSLSLRHPELGDIVGTASRQALERLVSLCIDEQVDALLLAGDLYDGDQTSMKTARFLAGQLRRLHEAGIPVFLIRGNHDAISKITRELTLPESVKLFGGRAEAVEIARPAGERPVVIHGVSFAESKAPDSLLPKYKPPVAGAVNIGLMHTSLGGSAGHDVYAPCGLAELQASGFRYWALGHIHQRQAIEGDCTVVMPGIPQGRDINEAGPKSVTLVTIGDGGEISVEERPTGLAEFMRVPVDLSGALDWADMVARLGAGLEAAKGASQSEHLVARLVLTGATPLAFRLRRDPDLLKGEADALADGLGRTFVEKVEIGCAAPLAEEGAAVDPIAELRALIGDAVAPLASYRADIRQMAEELRLQLPAECRHLLGEDEPEFLAAVDALIREGAEDVLARLHADARAEVA